MLEVEWCARAWGRPVDSVMVLALVEGDMETAGCDMQVTRPDGCTRMAHIVGYLMTESEAGSLADCAPR